MRALILGISLVLGACASNEAPQGGAPTPIAQRSETQTADIASLRGLTSILIDANSLYAAAADEADNAAYAQQIRTLAGRRGGMADEFQARVMTLGGAPQENGQALGTAHRVFMEARLLGENDTKVAVQEALRGETYLVDQLTEASTNQELSSATRAFVNGQIAGVRTDRDRLQAYADTLD